MNKVKKSYIELFSGDVFSNTSEENYPKIKKWLKENATSNGVALPCGGGCFLISLNMFDMEEEEFKDLTEENCEEDFDPYFMYELVYNIKKDIKNDPNKKDLIGYELKYAMESWN